MVSNRILVTGADGFIGSHLVELLIDQGFDVRAFCQYNSFGSWGWLKTISQRKKGLCVDVVLGDIRDSLSVRQAMTNCSVVYHLAALIAIPYSYVAPSSYIDTNIHGTLNVVQAARDLGVSRVVHTSTSETYYGTAQFVPITEDHPQVGQSPYAASKIGADQIALVIGVALKRPFLSCVRSIHMALDRVRGLVIPTIITQVASGLRQIRLGALSPLVISILLKTPVLLFWPLPIVMLLWVRFLMQLVVLRISIGDTAALIAEVMNTELEFITDEQRLRPAGSEVNRLFAITLACVP